MNTIPHLAACAAAVLFLALSAPAQSSRNLTGHYVGDPGPHPLAVLDGPQDVELAAPSLPFLVPKWDGRDDAGNAVPRNWLRGVQLSIRERLETRIAGENASPDPLGLWQTETGTRTFFALAPCSSGMPTPAEAFGGGSFLSHVVGDESLAGFDGVLDGAGPSGWLVENTSSPIAWEYLDLGANRADLLAWAGAGDVLVYALPRQASASHGFAGHWRAWSTASVEILATGSGGEIDVRYILAPPPFAGTWHVEPGAWVDYGMLRVGEVSSLDLPEGEGDPGQILAVFVDYAEESARWVGIENVSPEPGTCGGSSGGGVRITRDGHTVGELWTNSSANVGSFSALAAFDGATDWDGASGFESWAPASNTDLRRSELFPSEIASWAGCVQVEARVTHATIAPVSLTPGVSFDWAGAWRFTGRVRVVRIVR